MKKQTPTPGIYPFYTHSIPLIYPQYTRIGYIPTEQNIYPQYTLIKIPYKSGILSLCFRSSIGDMPEYTLNIPDSPYSSIGNIPEIYSTRLGLYTAWRKLFPHREIYPQYTLNIPIRYIPSIYPQYTHRASCPLTPWFGQASLIYPPYTHRAYTLNTHRVYTLNIVIEDMAHIP